MNKSLLLFTSLLFSISLWSQSKTQSVLSSRGGSFKGDKIHLDWTLGEPVVTTGSYGNNMLTQGFQQPTIIVKEVSSRNIKVSADISVTVAPNPVTSILTVELKTPAEEKAAIRLIDMSGRTFLNIRPTAEKIITLDVSSYQQGTYLLQILDEKSQQLKTFKIIKLK